MAAHILIIDDEKNIRTTLARSLDLEGFQASGAEDGAQGLAAVSASSPDLVLLDLKLPDMTGLEVLAELHAKHPQVAVVMMSGHGTVDAAIKATRLGAIDFLEKPIEMERLLLTVKNALKLADLDAKVGAMQQRIEQRSGMVGSSAALNHVLEAVRRAAPTKARVLITGESGVGKELVAQAIHDSSRRANMPFIKLNCAAMSQSLVESELFGHEKGAFTGADKRHVGRFERAHGGTLFLDEVGELPLATQAKLLRVLQEGELERVGGSGNVLVDVRVIAATNRDLLAEVAAGRFREDLYYRLAVVLVAVPPLRDRTDDIEALAQHWLQRACSENDLPHKEWSSEALVALRQHRFPGNVRELVHVVDRLAIMVAGSVIHASDVKQALHTPRKLEGSSIPETGTLYDLLEGFEKRVIEDRIVRFGGNMSRAAEDLGLERSHLYKKARRLGVQS
jgi:two-component system, NtrC family, nitrogen regulation response regulator NtrX